jgi:hypothetical protein
LGVNSSDIWGLEGPRGLDHALVIREIDLGQGVAVLSDPGNPEGNGWTVPLEVLENAWAEGDNTMIIAEQPAPAGAQVAAGERVESAPVGGEVSRDDHDAAIERFRGAVDPEASSIEAHGQLLTSSWSDAVTSVVSKAPWILVPVTIRCQPPGVSTFLMATAAATLPSACASLAGGRRVPSGAEAGHETRSPSSLRTSAAGTRDQYGPVPPK